MALPQRYVVCLCLTDAVIVVKYSCRVCVQNKHCSCISLSLLHLSCSSTMLAVTGSRTVTGQLHKGCCPVALKPFCPSATIAKTSCKNPNQHQSTINKEAADTKTLLRQDQQTTTSGGASIQGARGPPPLKF